MSLRLEEVNKVDKLIFLKFNAVNILIYCNSKEGIELIFTEIYELENKAVMFNEILDLLDNHVKKKVVLNKSDLEIIQKNANNDLKFEALFEDEQKINKYILIST